MGDEGDGGFDPCACMWNHDLAMQRLLSILRQSQAYCTDNECLTLSRLPGPPNGSGDNNFMMMCLFIVFGVMLYMFRPNTLRQPENAKARDSDPGSDGEPPMPPPAVN